MSLGRRTLVTLAALALVLSAYAGQDTSRTFSVKLEGNAMTIPTGKTTEFNVAIMPWSSLTSGEVSATMSMPSMAGMKLDPVTVTSISASGHFKVSATFPHAGKYVVLFTVKPTSGAWSTTALSLNVGAGGMDDMKGMPGMGDMHDMDGMSMKGSLGDWKMNREGSGTSWQPDSSPMFMKMLPKMGRYEFNVMGDVQTGYVDAGGKRGDSQVFANSMAMLMVRRETGGGTFGLDFMTSLDALTNGKRGVPNLFQTGETLNGQPLVDRQHPHDLFAEVAASYSHGIGKDARVFVYGGPVGEPALGNVMFMHRASGMEIPEAPITHHWFDSTHISFGVATLGFTLGDKWKFEGSAFNGHEPDENRYDFDPISLNSASVRVSFNPDKDWSLSASYGYLNSPEALEPGLDQHRLTASATYNRPIGRGDNLATTALFGRLIVPGRDDSDAFLLESTYLHRSESFFARFERVEKDELIGVPAGSYTINKVLFGDVHNFAQSSGFDFGIGGYLGLYSFPSSLKPFYGSNPITFGVFLRIRPSQMK